jgi:hypothetical protein
MKSSRGEKRPREQEPSSGTEKRPRVEEKKGDARCEVADPKKKGFLKLSLPGVFLINSKTRGGKSHLLHCSLYHYRKLFQWGIAFSQSCFNESNLSYIDGRFKHRRYKPAILREVLELQAKVPEKERKLIYIIFSDCISDLNENDSVLEECITQTFHYKVCVFIESQAINALPTWVRENAFQIALFKLWTESAIDAAYKSYGQNFENVKEFKRMVNNRLGDHKFAFSDRHEGDGSFVICRCPPPPLPKFLLKIPEKYEERGKGTKRKRDIGEKARDIEASNEKRRRKNRE